MKRERNRSSHATMLGGEQVKGLQGLRIADHDGNLPTLAAISGLPFIGRFGLFHIHSPEIRKLRNGSAGMNGQTSSGCLAAKSSNV